MLNIIIDNCKNIINNTDMSKLTNKKILITGASGLIGLHIAKTISLLNQNNKIVCIVNHLPETEFNNFFVDNNITLVVDNLINLINNTDFIKRYTNEFDVVIHAAGYAQPAKFTSDKITTILLNTEITAKLFDCLKENGSFLFCSSSEIYSGLIKENISEQDIGTTSPDHPRSCYIESKRCGEAICLAMNSQRNKIVKIARISSVYGPGTKKNDQRVMSELIRKAITNKQIELLDHGLSVRTLGYITDIIEMLFNILLHSNSTIYNVTGITEISILELAQKITTHTGCQLSLPSTNKTMDGNPQKVSISIDRYQKEFNKKNFVSIQDGLNKTIEYLKFLYV